MVSDFIYEKNIDVLAITESWLTLAVTDEMVQIDDYCIIKNNRGLKPNPKKKRIYNIRNSTVIAQTSKSFSLNKRRSLVTYITNTVHRGGLKRLTKTVKKPRAYIQGGGVLIYLRKGIRFKTLAASKITCINEPEFFIVAVVLENGERVLVAVVYRRPKGHVLAEFFKTLQHYSHLYANIIVLGDLNSDHALRLLQPTPPITYTREFLILSTIWIIASCGSH